MPINIRTALHNCQAREARSPLFILDKVKPLVVPVTLVAVGAAIPFVLPGIESMIHSVADTAQRVADNSTLIAQKHPELLYALGGISSVVGLMLSGVGFLEHRDSQKGMEKAQSKEIITATQNAWTTLTRTNDDLALQLSSRKDWLSKTLDDKSDLTTDVLANHGLDRTDRKAMVNLVRAHQFAVKYTIVRAANEGIKLDVNSLTSNPKSLQTMAEGMLHYHKSQSAVPSSLVSSLKSFVGIDAKDNHVELFRLARAGLEALRDLQVVHKGLDKTRDASGPSHSL
jgi:hypothetical protein